MTTPGEYLESVERRWRFNLKLLTVIEGLWGAGFAFVSTQSILPVFLQSLGASGKLIGLLPALVALGATLPQLVGAYFTEHLRKKKNVVIWLHLPILAGSYLLTWAAFAQVELGREAALSLALLSQFLVGLALGMVLPVWQAMVSKVLPERLQGRGIGTTMFASGLMGILAAGPASYLINQLAPPVNYGYCFLASSVLWTVGFALMLRLREVKYPAERRRPCVGEYLRLLKQSLVENKSFLWLIVTRALAGLGLMGSAFAAVWAVEALGLSQGSSAWMAAASTLAGTLASPVAGWLGDKGGFKPLLVAGLAAGMLSPFVLLFAKDASLVYVSFALGGVAMSLSWLVQWRLTLKLCPHEDATTFLALVGALATPTAVIAPLLGGWLVDVVAEGYRLVFALSTVFAFAALLVGSLAVKETPAPKGG